MSDLVSFWLLPAEPAATQLQRTIDALSLQHAAPGFAPHITLWSGIARTDRADRNWRAVLEQAANAIAPFSVTVRAVEHSGELWKSLYLKIEPAEPLRELSRRLRELSDNDDYVLEPHLSLMYRVLPSEQRRELVAQVRAPRSFVCDALAVVLPGPSGFDDVAAWTQPATCYLGRAT